MKRGDIWIVNLEPGFGRELHKKRPALIISDDSVHKKTHSIIIIPASSQAPKVIGSEMVVIDTESGVDKRSVLLPVFIRSVDKERLIKKIGTLSQDKMSEVEDALRLVLQISDTL